MLLGALLFLGTGSIGASVNFRGDQFGWNDNDNNELYHIEGSTKYSRHFDRLNENTEFKITENGTYYGWGSSKYWVTSGNTKVTLESGENLYISTNLFDVTVTYDSKTKELSFNSTDGYAIHYEKGGNWYDTFFKKKTDKDWELYFFTGEDINNFGVIKYENCCQTSWYASSSSNTASLKANSDNSTKQLVTSNTVDVKFERNASDKRSGYLFKWNTNGNLSVEEYFPSSLYIYGDLKEKSWDSNDYYDATFNNGIYKFKDVYIRGEKANVNENYIAFFSFIDNNGDSDLDYDIMLPRYGCVPSEANYKNTNVRITNFNNYYNIAGNNQNNYNNYCVAQGIYDIEVDLFQMRIKFIPVELEYQWYNHDGSESVGTSHETTYGVDNKIQVAARDDVHHPVADLARFNVEYEPLQSTSGFNVKAKASTVTNNEEYYTIDNDYVITLKKTGNYTVTASLPQSEFSEYYDVRPSTLNVSVTPLTASLADTDNDRFWSQDETTLPIAVLNSSNANIEPSEFTVTVEPTFEKVSISNAENEMAWWDYDQMVGIEASTQKVDGYYPAQAPEYTVDIDDNKELNVIGFFPVSGTYKVTVTSTDGTVTFGDDGATSVSANFDIRPNIDLSYKDGYTVTHNVNGKTEESNVPAGDAININNVKLSNGTIDYYYDEESNQLYGGTTTPILYTPGNYLDVIKYKVSATELLPSSISDYTTSTDHTIDISLLLNNDRVYLYIMLEKNGLSSEVLTPVLVKVTSVPTAVDTIGVEEGEAVYFNLQGVRVANPEHGIFVKVQNGKATKVVM